MTTTEILRPLASRIVRIVALTTIACGGDSSTPSATVPVVPAIPTVPTPRVAPDRGADWATYNGDFAHTGYVNLTPDPAKFRPLFEVIPYPGYVWHQPTTGAGLVYLTAKENPNDTARIVALDGRTGARVWQRPIHDNSTQSQFTYDGTSLFFTSASVVWALDPATGTVRWRTQGPNDQHQYLAPVIAGTALVTGGAVDPVSPDYKGGFTGYDRITGRQKYSVPSTATAYPWAPAVRNTLVHTVLAGVRSFDSNDGSLRTRFTIPTTTTDGTPLISSYGTLLTLQGVDLVQLGTSLVGVDLTSSGRLPFWSVTGTYNVMPVVASTTVYVATVTRVEARSEFDGSLKWTFDLNSDPFLYPQQLIVANNVLVVTSRWVGAPNGTTLVIDLETHKLLWQYPRGGEIAVSRDGILYINSVDHLAAVALW